MTRKQIIWVCLAAVVGAIGMLYNSPFNPYRFNTNRYMDYRNAADSAYIKGDYPEAERLSLAALKEAEKKSPENDMVVTSLHYLGTAYKEQKKDAEAEKAFRRAVDIAEKIYGSNSEDTLFALGDIAFFYTTQKRFSEAELFNQRSLNICARSVSETYKPSCELAKMYERWIQAKEISFNK